MRARDENVWRAQIARAEKHRRRGRSPRRLSRHYPRYRPRRAWNAVPALKWGLAVAVVLILLKVALA